MSYYNPSSPAPATPSHQRSAQCGDATQYFTPQTTLHTSPAGPPAGLIDQPPAGFLNSRETTPRAHVSVPPEDSPSPPPYPGPLDAGLTRSALQRFLSSSIAFDEFTGPLITYLQERNLWEDFCEWFHNQLPDRQYPKENTAPLLEGLIRDWLRIQNVREVTPASIELERRSVLSARAGSSTPAPAAPEPQPRLPHDMPYREREDGTGLEIYARTQEQRDQLMHFWGLQTHEDMYGFSPHPPSTSTTSYVQKLVKGKVTEMDCIRAFAFGVSTQYAVRRTTDAFQWTLYTPAKTHDKATLRKRLKVVGEESGKQGCKAFDEELMVLAAEMRFTGIRDDSELGGQEWVDYMLECTKLPHFHPGVALCIQRYEPSVDSVALRLGPLGRAETVLSANPSVRLFDQKKRYFWYSLDQYLIHFWGDKREALKADWERVRRDRMRQASGLVSDEGALPAFHPYYRPRAPPSSFGENSFCSN